VLIAIASRLFTASHDFGIAFHAYRMRLMYVCEQDFFLSPTVRENRIFWRIDEFFQLVGCGAQKMHAAVCQR
jgi:hypothetical protein